MEKEIKKVAIKNGFNLAIIYSIITILIYIFNLSLFTNIWMGISLIFLLIIFSIYNVFVIKKMIFNSITFRQAFSSYIIPIIICLGINSVVLILIFNFIDTEAKEIVNENYFEFTKKTMNLLGKAEIKNEEQFIDLENGDIFSISNIIKSYINKIILHSIFGLLIAFFFKSTNSK